MNVFSIPFVGKVLKWLVCAFFASTILAVVIYKVMPVYITPLMFIRMIEAVGNHDVPKLRHHWVPMEDIAPDMALAVIASEDAHFRDHHGFDYDAIIAAQERNKEAGKTKFGASTISQQTAKNVFLWQGRSWLRKGLEVYFTVLIELIWGKERIMEVYLNSIEMGDGIYGVDAVAEENFQKLPKDLTRRECALIAVTLPNPRLYSSKNPSDRMLKRRNRIVHDINFVKWK